MDEGLLGDADDFFARDVVSDGSVTLGFTSLAKRKKQAIDDGCSPSGEAVGTLRSKQIQKERQAAAMEIAQCQDESDEGFQNVGSRGLAFVWDR